jgi:hypothetical protein
MNHSQELAAQPISTQVRKCIIKKKEFLVVGDFQCSEPKLQLVSPASSAYRNESTMNSSITHLNSDDDSYEPLRGN